MRTLIGALGADDRLAVERVAGGTSLFRLTPRGVDAAAMRDRLLARGVVIAPPDNGGFWLKVNASLAGRDGAAIAGAFREALA